MKQFYELQLNPAKSASRHHTTLRTASIALAIVAVLASLGCSHKSEQAVGATSSPDAAPAGSGNPQREAYFGDLHLHTTNSFDAYVMSGTHTTPDEAYRFAKGETISYFGHPVKRRWALDFMAVTDHSENMGVFNELDDPNSAFSKSPLGQRVLKQGAGRLSPVFWEIVTLFTSGKPIPDIDAKAISTSVWQQVITAANTNYVPGKFTTFIGYEWTSMPDAKFNLHRNVIFRGDTAPVPFTALDSRRPEDLWTYLEANRRQGVEALAITHNANASDGLMYDWKDSDGKRIDQAYAQRRIANEPLAEISQNKGQSETVPDLSPTDEFANFEVFQHLLVSRQKSTSGGSYVRDALGRGLVLEAEAGTNPYKLGFVGGTDFHTGLSTSNEDAFNGSGGIDPDADLPDVKVAKELLERKHVDAEHGYDLIDNGSGNLAGVWAEENTRPSIYDALRRKETFATSGTRLKFRFFGGWDFATDLTQQPEWIKAAYQHGVPMGGDLPARSEQAAPRFALWAIKDPDAANLDRIQVVKVWLEKNEYREKVFDVALSQPRKVDPATGKAPAVGNTVDVKTATYTNTIGATELSAVWEDPEFDAAKPALYYLRVLEIPTPRWSTILAVKRGLALPKEAPLTIQERGWSSPIWYTPPASRNNGAT
jgi:hypothetical protein